MGTADLVVLLGTPTPASSRLYALTVTEGDPTWAGPLAGEALGLPVFHVIEPEVKAQVDDAVYQAEVGMTVTHLEAVRAHEVSGLRNGPQVKAGSITRHLSMQGALSRRSKAVKRADRTLHYPVGGTSAAYQS